MVTSYPDPNVIVVKLAHSISWKGYMVELTDSVSALENRSIMSPHDLISPVVSRALVMAKAWMIKKRVVFMIGDVVVEVVSYVGSPLF